MYKITQYTKEKAKKLGVIISPSTNPVKKIDVFDKRGKFLCSIGASNYADYPTYIKTKGKEYADRRRALYKIRHNGDRHIKGTPGYFADQLLW
jgi:hypothetical protein